MTDLPGVDITPLSTVYIELDGPVADIAPALRRLPQRTVQKYRYPGEIPGVYALTELTEGAVEALEALRRHYRVLIVTSDAWDQPRAASDRLRWLHTRIGHIAEGVAPIRLVSTPDASLLRGAVLVRSAQAGNLSPGFDGRVLELGSAGCPDWAAVTAHLLENLVLAGSQSS